MSETRFSHSSLTLDRSSGMSLQSRRPLPYLIVYLVGDPAKAEQSVVAPVNVEAVLLPFKGKIIYDGLLLGYNIAFGGGIRSRFTQIYLTAKYKQRIVTSLEPD